VRSLVLGLASQCALFVFNFALNKHEQRKPRAELVSPQFAKLLEPERPLLKIAAHSNLRFVASTHLQCFITEIISSFFAPEIINEDMEENEE